MRSSALVLVIALAASLSACGDRGSFDKERWASRRGIYNADNPRISMVGEAKRAGVRPGTTRAQVRALLGPPDGIDTAGDIWYLGRSHVAPDFQSLEVEYDASGVVTRISTPNS